MGAFTDYRNARIVATLLNEVVRHHDVRTVAARTPETCPGDATYQARGTVIRRAGTGDVLAIMVNAADTIPVARILNHAANMTGDPLHDDVNPPLAPLPAPHYHEAMWYEQGGCDCENESVNRWERFDGYDYYTCSGCGRRYVIVPAWGTRPEREVEVPRIPYVPAELAEHSRRVRKRHVSREHRTARTARTAGTNEGMTG